MPEKKNVQNQQKRSVCAATLIIGATACYQLF